MSVSFFYNLNCRANKFYNFGALKRELTFKLFN